MACCCVWVIGMLAEYRHQQVARTVERAQSKLSALEHSLRSEHIPPPACPPISHAARESQGPRRGDAAEGRAEKDQRVLAGLRVLQGGGKSLSNVWVNSRLDTARFMLSSALSEEGASWCRHTSCSHERSATPHAAATAEAEARQLRLAVVRANARAMEANEAATRQSRH